MSMRKQEGMSRRSFLGYITGAIVAFVGAIVAVPVVGGFVSPALKKTSAGTWEKLGSSDKFVLGVPKIVGVAIVKKDGWVESRTTRLVWVIRTGEKAFKELERELKLKDKALKEATALLILKKKVELIFPAHEAEESTETTDKPLSNLSKKPIKTEPD